MTLEQSLILLVLVVAMGMFIWGRWRHDMVALGALLACVFFRFSPSGHRIQWLWPPSGDYRGMCIGAQ